MLIEVVTLPSLGVSAVEPQKEKLKKAPANSFVILLFLSRGAMGLDINILSCLDLIEMDPCRELANKL
ncbi:hypothetical protein WN944_008010 [Citrus x changshan-huyou]|uniref:Uncharacterized protein n=1 Tax=Citrus x changshan-huyou TaxID=2935761 RepID=A0AAP0MM42_9ROSI